MNKKTEIRNIVLIIIIGVLFFIPYLGSVHLFDWDEINFAEASREMLVTGDYLTVRIDYKPFHEKPPLFFWLQAASMKIFGVNEFAARLPNAMTGIISLIFIYLIGKKIFDFRFGMLWVLTYIGSFLPFLYFKSGIIDPVFNLFIFAGLYFLSKMELTHIENKYNKNWHNSVLAGLFVALAILTKGPVGYLLPTLSFFIFAIANRKRSAFPFKQFLLYSAIALVPAIIWYILVYSLIGGNILEQFINYQLRLLTTGDAGHGGPFYYHFVVLLLGCFPASIFALRAFRKNPEDTLMQKYFRQWAIILLCVVLGVFSAVETKIVHYSSLAYFPLTFLSTYTIYSLLNESMQWKRSTAWLIGIIGSLSSILFIAFPLLLMNIELYLPKVKDPFTYELLKANVNWSGYEYIFGFLYLIAVIFSLFMFARRNILKGYFIIFSSTAILMFLFLPVLAPKIEGYTQDAPIEFYKSLKGKECYVRVLGFKSYADLFYTQKPMHLSEHYIKTEYSTPFEEWLLHGKIDKPAYFVCKNTSAKKYLSNPGMLPLYQKNGYVFMKRVAVR